MRSRDHALPLLLLGIFLLSATGASQAETVQPRLVEVFTVTGLPAKGFEESTSGSGAFATEIQVYRLDGIQRIEARLSQGLPADPASARRIALQRIQGLDEQAMAEMQRSAIGLAKAMQYGIDRYPAMVFDGEALIYGVTDLEAALARYRDWRDRRRP